MKFNPLPFALVAFVAACDNDQPFIFAEGEDGPVAEGDGSIEDILDEDTEEVDLDDNEESRGDIVRLELRDLETGAGFAEDFTLDGDDDTLTIDNLAFDGFNVYTRGANTPVPKLSDIGTIAVYHGDETVPDFLTGTPVPQFVPHVALYEESAVTIAGDEDGDPADQPRTSFAIVRTGTYSDVPNPGGFVYQRAGDVVLPDTGQATFSGDYGALRIYDELDQLEIIEGDITINIDFDDFNELDGVAGVVTNRQAFDQFGNALPTTNEIDRAGLPADVIQLPPVVFDIRISGESIACLLYTSPSPRDRQKSRMPSSA